MPSKKPSSRNEQITIALLLVALLAGIAVIAVELKRHSTTSAVRTVRLPYSAPRSAESSKKTVPNCVLERNPFAKPLDLRTSEGDSGPTTRVRQHSFSGRTRTTWRIPGVIPNILPASIYSNQMMVRKVEPEFVETSDSSPQASKLPEAVLMGIIQGPNGSVGIIGIGTSPAQTVVEGDVLNDGFRVKKIGADYAVLTKGEDEIIAKRPRN